MRRYARNPEVVVVTNPAPSSFRKGKHMKRRKRRNRRRSRRNLSYNRGRSRRYNRGRRRRTRRNRGRGKYSSFVKAHKGLFKKMSFKAATRKIASMWRRK